MISPTMLAATTARRSARPTTVQRAQIVTGAQTVNALTARLTQIVLLANSAATENVLQAVVILFFQFTEKSDVFSEEVP